MKRTPWSSWCMLALWSLWLSAAQGWLESRAPTGSGLLAPPDASLVLLVVLAARLPTAELLGLALLTGLGRAAVSIDPPQAVLAAHMATVLAARMLRQLLELDGPFVRAVLAGCAALGMQWWLDRVHLARLPLASARILAIRASEEASAWPVVLSTALAALLFGPLLGRLPGLSPLRRRRRWRVDGSGR